MKKTLTYLCCLFLVFLFTSWGIENKNTKSYTKKLYTEIHNLNLDFEIFHKSIIGYHYLINKGKISNKRYLSIVDMSVSANKKRYYLIDMKEKKVISHSLIAHGKNTGSEYAKYFSNIQNSYQSSIGFYTTAETYYGDNGLSMRMDGLEYTNNKARVRDIVVHKADYVSDEFINQHGRLGRSFGCPALPIKGYEKIINKIKNGSCFFIYYPDSNYLKKSIILNKSEEINLK